jgi:hypothetical protein
MFEPVLIVVETVVDRHNRSTGITEKKVDTLVDERAHQYITTG